MLPQLELEVEQLLAQAKAADNQAQSEGRKRMEELTRRGDRQEREAPGRKVSGPKPEPPSSQPKPGDR